MSFRISILVLLVVGRINDFIQGQIIFPDVPNLAETLNVVSNISTRFSFPNNQDNCVTSSGENGKCRPLNQCPELLDFVHKRGGLTTSQGISHLRNRICGFQGRSVKLCCVEETTPLINPPNNTQIGKVPIPTTDECGVALVRRITNGKEFKRGAHPWLAGLGYPREDGTFRVLCGGAVITKRHVITAAHCFIRQPGLRPITHVRLGEHSLSDNSERVQPITLRIMDRKSPGYDRVSHVNDLELVVMEKEIQFTDYVRPACLPFGFENTNFDHEVMTIVGWGHTFFRSAIGTDKPLAANISVIPKDICRQDYISEPQVPLNDTQLCAGKGLTDACQGDSGGPLLFHQTRTYLLGVISFGVGCANENFPGVYAFIPEYLKWISDNV